MSSAPAFSEIHQKIGYNFQSTDLLEQALTHRSASTLHNERLEFLGDAILGQIITLHIFSKFPEAPEGKLTRLRSNMVRGKNLAIVCRGLKIQRHLILGQGEIKSGGINKESMQANLIEALIGAIYLDSDLSKVTEVVLNWFAPQLEKLSLADVEKDPKSLLQEKLQSLKLNLPEYEILSIEGAEHDQVFHVSCRINGLDITTHGRGSTRRIAEQNAARQAIAEVES